MRLARSEGRQRVRAVRDLCREARVTLRDRARQLREELKNALQAERAALRGSCHDRLARARQETDKAIEEARKTAVEVDRLRRVARSPAQQHAAERARLARATAIRESDDEVRRNLPEDLGHVWQRVKSRIRGGPRRTRTEAFLEWAEENAGDVARMLAEHAESRQWREETEQEYRARQEPERKPRARRARTSTSSTGTEVPF